MPVDQKFVAEGLSHERNFSAKDLLVLGDVKLGKVTRGAS
jgi:hypothetical protein